MDLGISTYTFPWAVGVPGYLPDTPKSWSDLMTFCTQNQVQRFQIGDNFPLHALSSSVLTEYIRQAEDRTIQLEVGTRRLEKVHLLNYLSIARQARSPFLRVVIDDTDYEPDEESVIEIIGEVLPHFRSENVMLSLENHDRFSSSSLLNIILETDPEWVGICLDTSNSLRAGEGVEQVLHTLLPFILNLHYKDIQIERVGHKMGFMVQGCEPGTGIISLDSLIQTLGKSDRCQSVTLEQWPPFVENLDHTIQQERDWALKGVHFLRHTLNFYSQHI
ncbi:sugar phosphate isomerase/epimerase family protein [Arundinibacter roseus]|uniref:Sugar phosphate isomerase/epimerase n=1 Tax=Arundinibacter roseus TaxID=2070510 RepID=A0A4R4JXH1_9BACT|nr:sugar phosphate isomerase/epimerase [Arundinibacter roseus]TDB59540.1 sugar phosphate isomerase/epimerase [Arundinibacter roseus]